MNSLLISDLHLTANPRDEYRWKLFPWLREECRKHGVKTLFILGDLTDAKDFHSAALVNRIVEELLKTYREGQLLEIYIVPGNHDGIDPGCRYFKFLGRYPCITYVQTPFAKPFDGNEVLMLPHTRDPGTDWETCEMHHADFVFMHQTLRGAESETGFKLEGMGQGLLATARRARIYSGDVHVPQRVGRVEYVGAPYPVRFGDSYKGRAILLHNWGNAEDLHFPSIQRLTVYLSADGLSLDVAQDDLRAGDQVKVRVKLAPSEYGLWPELKRWAVAWAKEAELELCGLELERQTTKPMKIQLRGPQQPGVTRDPELVLRDFCKAQELDGDLPSVGAHILQGALAHG